MDTMILYNVIRKLIVPKYDWIDSFEWRKEHDFETGVNIWSLFITPNSDFDVDPIDASKIRQEINDDVSAIFAMLNPTNKDQFYWVYFN